MLAPKIAGRIPQALQVTGGRIGARDRHGSGFLTACLALQGGAVRSLELHADLASAARRDFAALGFGRAEVAAADAFAAGALGSASYDVVVLTGSLPIYDPRFEQRLAVGGRLFAVVGKARRWMRRWWHRRAGVAGPRACSRPCCRRCT